jgi:hypothetical protein
MLGWLLLLRPRLLLWSNRCAAGGHLYVGPLPVVALL